MDSPDSPDIVDFCALISHLDFTLLEWLAMLRLGMLLAMVATMPALPSPPCGYVLAQVQFLQDYALWRRWEQAAIYIPSGMGCGGLLGKHAAKTLSRAGVPVSLQLTSDPRLPTAVVVPRHRAGVAVFGRRSQDYQPLLTQVSEMFLFNEYLSWLIVLREEIPRDFLGSLNIGLDSDFVVASTTCHGDQEREPDVEGVLTTSTTPISQETREVEEVVSSPVKLSHFHKVRPSLTDSLSEALLGLWGAGRGAADLRRPQPLEARGGFRGLPLRVGVKDPAASTPASPADVGLAADDEQEEWGDVGDVGLMTLLEFVASSMNASYELVAYPKVGWRNEEGAWLHLLGDVVKGAVDLGLEEIVVTGEMARDMAFSMPVLRSEKKVYLRRPDAGALRDIFLEPFGPRLLGGLAVTALALGVAAAVVNATVEPRGGARWGFGDSLVWSVGLLCMQGSPWSPRTPSGSLLLFCSLLFALVMYNAYAAFVTSVLSVQAAPIRGLHDLLARNFAFGYVLGGQDDNFLRTVNDTTLRQLYFRGLVRAQGVHEPAEGLARASRGGYAFFTSSREARRSLEAVPHELRCDMQAVRVPAAAGVVALPLSSAAPAVRKLVDLSLLRMREVGALRRLQESVAAAMPLCRTSSSFISARLSDVYSAFLLLSGGLVLGLGLAVVEVLWLRRQTLAQRLAAVPRHRCRPPAMQVPEDAAPPVHFYN